MMHDCIIDIIWAISSWHNRSDGDIFSFFVLRNARDFYCEAEKKNDEHFLNHSCASGRQCFLSIFSMEDTEPVLSWPELRFSIFIFGLSTAVDCSYLGCPPTANEKSFYCNMIYLWSRCACTGDFMIISSTGFACGSIRLKCGLVTSTRINCNTIFN